MMYCFIILITILNIVYCQVNKQFYSINDIPLDNDNHVKNHWLIYLNNPYCKNQVEEIWRKTIHDLRLIAGANADLATDLFSLYDISEESCVVTSIERGVKYELIKYPLESRYFPSINTQWSPSTNYEQYYSRSFQKYINLMQTIEVGLVSYMKGGPGTVYWINENNKQRVNVGTLNYGERNTMWQTTQLGHKFEIEDANNQLMGRVVAEHNSFFHFGEPGSGIHEQNVTKQIRHAMDAEYDRSKSVKRTFTKLGFDKGKLPLDLWASMSTYYYNNRYNKVREEWDNKGYYVNWWEREVYVIVMGPELRFYWQSRLKTLVEKWSGVELEVTDMYGLRQYEDGARLLTHVDRESTHAASLIINIEQHAMRAPWPVEIYDFANRLHEIDMSPGDIVYYESARCLHGRNRPLPGAFYVNLFAHYRPIGDPNWYKKPNPSDAPEHLIDIGECKINPIVKELDPNDVTKITNFPICDSKSVPYLSATLYKINSGADLFNWWIDTLGNHSQFPPNYNISQEVDPKVFENQENNEDYDDDDESKLEL